MSIDEAGLITALKRGVMGLSLPAPQDLRGKLSTNSDGKSWKIRPVDGIQGLVFHQELGWGTVEAVADYHTGPTSHLSAGGVESISYTLAIRRDGQICLCNDLQTKTWSQGDKNRPGDENAEFMGVMFEGYFNYPGCTFSKAGEPTAAQILAGMLLFDVCSQMWGWTDAGLWGHHLFGKPACPGSTLQAVVDAVRLNAPADVQWDFSKVEDRQAAIGATADGIWGPGSKAKLVEFQRKHSLVADGIWGPQTERKIIELG